MTECEANYEATSSFRRCTESQWQCAAAAAEVGGDRASPAVEGTEASLRNGQSPCQRHALCEADLIAAFHLPKEMTKPTFRTEQVAPAPYPVEGVGYETFSTRNMYAALIVIPAVIQLIVGLQWYYYFPIAALCLVPAFAAFQIASSRINTPLRPQKGLPGLDTSAYMTFKLPVDAKRYEGRTKIPIETFFEAYFDEEIDLTGDMLATLEARYDWAAFTFTFRQAKFFVSQWLPETLWHSRQQDENQVREHYDRGDDFYNWFRKYHH